MPHYDIGWPLSIIADTLMPLSFEAYRAFSLALSPAALFYY
jgi:hypothetical protein